MVVQGGGLSALYGYSDFFRQVVDLPAFGRPYVCDLVASSVYLLLPCLIVVGSLVARYPIEVDVFAAKTLNLFPYSYPYVD